MQVRDARDEDIETVLDMARRFCAVAGEPFDRDHTLTNLAGIRASGFMLLVEDAAGPQGMLGAIAAPGLCSPQPVLHEVCMWVEPGSRGGAALLRLVREFDRRAQAQGLSSQLSTLPTSPEALAGVYARLGYAPVGSSYIKRRSA